MRIAKIASLALAGAMLSGCWTFNKSEYPTAPVTKAPEGRDISIAVNGFEALVTTTVSVNGYRTIWTPGYCDPYGVFYGGCYQAIPTTSFVEQYYKTDAYQKRARRALEDAGYVVGAQTPQWTVEVEFIGPTVVSGDGTKEACVMIGSIFFCDYVARNWHAKLRLRDNRTGKLALSHDYDQRYQTNVFGLIPIFGISSCNETSEQYMQGWCLAALVDRVLSDVTAFIASSKL